MGKLEIFAVRDTKVSSFGMPFTMKNVIEATRALQTAVNDEATQLAHYPEDFELCKVGEFDDVTGIIRPLDRPQFIISAMQLVKIDYRKKLEEELKKQSMKGEENGNS